jgi:hypothetical protein
VRRIATILTGAAAIIVVVSSVSAHEWSGLTTATPDPRRLEIAVDVAEGLQATTLASTAAQPLTRDPWVVDWLVWLSREAGLDQRRERDALADDLVGRGFVDADERELAVRAWRHALEHLTLVADAVQRKITPADAAGAAARLADPDLDPDEAQRLSYVASLGEVGQQERETLAPLLERLSRLVGRPGAALGTR